MNEKMPPVAFRDAKPINRKERHPFTGEPTNGPEPGRVVLSADTGDSDLDSSNEPIKATVNCNEVLAALRYKRDELDSAIRLIEQLLR